MFESIKNSFTEAEETSEKEQQVEEDKDTKKKKGQKGGVNKSQNKKQPQDQKSTKSKVPFLLAIALIAIITHSTFTYVCHSVHVASEAYSSPSVVLAGRRPDGSKQIIDDFRESYDWL